MQTYVNFNGSNSDEPKTNSKVLLEAQIRITKIREYVKKKELEQLEKEEKEIEEYNKCLEQISELKERILAILSVATVCTANGIDIYKFTVGADELPLIKISLGLKGVANALCLRNYTDWNLYLYPDMSMIGINRTFTDKVKSISKEDLKLLQKFIEDFDEFEADFNYYIDQLLSSKEKKEE